MDKIWDHNKNEADIYKLWESKEIFRAKVDKTKKPFTIVLPPPNANGKLHVGHVLMIAIEDLLIRYKKMNGYETLWIPGTDHAGFETQVVFERQLEEEKKSRFDFDRDTFYEKVHEFVENQRGTIVKQSKAMGASLDWSREKYTLNPDVINTVYSTFSKMAKENLVYRDDYMVNYCVYHGTTLAELEVKHLEQKTPLYYVKYKLVDKKDGEPDYITVATTRPEPIFVDTHLAVNPKDKKNIWLKGRKVVNPLNNKKMEIIADEFVDPKFGTGIVKLTPAHDKTDYEVAKTHNLPVVSAFIIDGLINEMGGKLKGLSISEARKKAVLILKEKGLLEKVDENYQNSVSVCYKCKRPIEPFVMPNWFIKVKDLKKPALDCVLTGKVKIHPKWQEKKYVRWMEDMHDWPISRQIVWGIRIPAWYDISKNKNIQITFLKDGQIISGLSGELLSKYSFSDIQKGLQSISAPIGAKYVIGNKKPDGNYLQETDTFDTWFSSGQWPLVTLGYPDSNDFKYFYPTSVLETGWEILRFWVSRMIMFGIYLTKTPPFKDVYLHGLVRATDGRKMSKSLGNVIDPLDYVNQYGADALRMGLISGTATGKDFNFPHDKVVAYRNFANKIWNIARFIEMIRDKNPELPDFESIDKSDLKKDDLLLLKDFEKCIGKLNQQIETFRFAQAGENLYHFIWDELASKHLESTKSREDKEIAFSTLIHVFKNSLLALHPFMPFVTEKIYQTIFSKDNLIISNPWPYSSK